MVGVAGSADALLPDGRECRRQPIYLERMLRMNVGQRPFGLSDEKAGDAPYTRYKTKNHTPMTILNTPQATMRVVVYQPVIPDYRVPLFNGLANQKNLILTVFASKSFPQSPDTSKHLFEFSYVECSTKSFLNANFFWQIGKSIPDELGPNDAIVLSGNIRLLSNIPLIAKAKLRRIPIVWWTHARSSSSSLFWYWIRRRIIHIVADTVLLYTDAEKKTFLKNWDGPPVWAANNALDTKPIDSEKRKWTPEKIKEFKIKNKITDKKLIIFSSRLYENKKIELLIKAVSEIKSHLPNIYLVIIGDGPHAEHLKAMVRTLQLDGHVRFMGKLYEENQLAPWFLASELFVYPGPIGLSILHAFAYGLPVITHDNPSKHEPEFFALEPGFNGFTFRYGDYLSMAECIKQYLVSNFDKKIISSNAYFTAKEKINMPAMISRFREACAAAVEYKRRRKIF